MFKGLKRNIITLAALVVLVAIVLSGCTMGATTGGTSSGSSSNSLMAFLPLVLIVAVMYFLLIRPQQKKTKQVNEMRGGVKPGDWVTTIGGFRGRVIRIHEDVITIAVGADKTKLDIMRWGVSKIDEAAPPKASKAQVFVEDDDEDEVVEEAPKKPKKLQQKKAAPVPVPVEDTESEDELEAEAEADEATEEAEDEK